jgi:hypothetical protein
MIYLSRYGCNKCKTDYIAVLPDHSTREKTNKNWFCQPKYTNYYTTKYSAYSNDPMNYCTNDATSKDCCLNNSLDKSNADVCLSLTVGYFLDGLQNCLLLTDKTYDLKSTQLVDNCDIYDS